MPTKPQLIATLGQFDSTTLERLVNLADKLLLPDEDLLVNVTFEQMVAKAHALADVYFPTWTDRSKADFGEFLVELFALFSEKDFWYINAFHNEAFIQRANSYLGVYMHALRLGYIPRVLTGAKGNALVYFAPGDEVILAPGDLQLECKENGLVYTNYEHWVVQSSLGTLTKGIRLVEGEYSVTQRNFNGKSIKINVLNASVLNVSVTVDDNEFTGVDSFSLSTPNSRVYVTMPTDDGFELLFGDNVYGVKPAIGSVVVVRYLVTHGSAGNLPASGSQTRLFTVKKAPDYRSVLSATYSSADGFSGGNDYESKEDIRHNASLLFRSRGSIINPQDAEAFLVSLPDIVKAKAYVLLGVLNFSIVHTNGLGGSSLSLANCRTLIDERLVMGFASFGKPTVFKTISSITISAYVLSGYSHTDIEAQIKDFILNYTDPTSPDSTFGRSFMLTDVANEIIQNIVGVQNIVFNSLNGVTPAANYLVGQYEILGKVSENNIAVFVYNY